MGLQFQSHPFVLTIFLMSAKSSRTSPFSRADTDVHTERSCDVCFSSANQRKSIHSRATGRRVTLVLIGSAAQGRMVALFDAQMCIVANRSSGGIKPFVRFGIGT